ncbi:MAG TPA: endo-1,4-beta-xylanase [Bacteroidales bacterium]|nr:endo-1,4-beta-xylanase [Bacteroidales bacterium]
MIKNYTAKLNFTALIAFVILASLLVSCSSNEKKKIPSISKTYQDYFPIGVAVSSYLLHDSATADFVKRQFNSITPENEMKPENLQPEEGKFTWKRADRIANFAANNGMKLRGHCLVWHQQTPDWFFMDGNDTASAELVFKRMKDHIYAVVNHFKGKAYCWDVVNEAISDDSTKFLREESPWLKICGPSFIDSAFVYAHQADPSAKLFYNDYNVVRPEKAARVYRLLKELKSRGVPVDGVGIQAHWSLYEPSAEELRDVIDKFKSLGLDVQFTELDVSVFKWEKNFREIRPSDNLAYTDSLANVLADKYSELFSIFREYHESITGVTFWSVSDRTTWLNYYPVRGRQNYPMLFDTLLKPKKAFWDVVEFNKENQ